MQEDRPIHQNPEPTPRDRRILWLWCLGTLFPCISLMLYLPMSTNPEFESFSEEPHRFTAFLAVCLLLSLACFFLKKGPAFPPVLRRKMGIGTTTGAVMFGAYATYVYSFSQLPSAPNAPQIGQVAPNFSVTDPDGDTHTLHDMNNDVFVFFYRGHW